jgi:hypothetical protein
MFDCTQLSRDQIGQVENDGLEGENVFELVYEVDSGDLGVDNTPTDRSCIHSSKK